MKSKQASTININAMVEISTMLWALSQGTFSHGLVSRKASRETDTKLNTKTCRKIGY